MLVSETLAVLKKAGLKDDVAVVDLTARLDILLVNSWCFCRQLVLKNEMDQISNQSMAKVLVAFGRLQFSLCLLFLFIVFNVIIGWSVDSSIIVITKIIGSFCILNDMSIFGF